MASNWFVEETMPNGSYLVVRHGLNEAEALKVLYTHRSKNRLEMWSRSHAEGPKGFAPAAFKGKDGKVMISNTLAMLSGLKKAS